MKSLSPEADLVINLTPDKQHSQVVETIMPLMKQNSRLSYSHGFNIVEVGMRIRPDITVIMVAPKGPGTELRREYQRGFGIPTLIAVHGENDPRGVGLEIAKAYACGTGGDRAGVLHSSFIAEVKSDLMGEQTILCGLLQAGSLLCYDKMIEEGIDSGYASKLVQNGWEVITEALKFGGITLMMDRLSNPAKIRAHLLAEEFEDDTHSALLPNIWTIFSQESFSRTMMADWENNDAQLLEWRRRTGETAFEQAVSTTDEIAEQDYFDKGILLVAFVKAGVELAFDTMVAAGIKEESAYYESLHEVPLIANLIARKKLYEMNVVISDTAEYGCYLFAHEAVPLLGDFMDAVSADVLGAGLDPADTGVDNLELLEVNEAIRYTEVEAVGAELRAYMGAMQPII